MASSEGFISGGGYKVHYVEWGLKGPSIVLIHSMGMDDHSMDKLCESLKSSYKILSLTILGHGDSDVPTVVVPLLQHAELMRQCIKKKGFKSYSLIGHSIGGMMGMILAADHPDEIQGLVLVDIAPSDPNAPRPFRMTRPQPPDSFRNESEARAYLKERYPDFDSYYVENRLRYSFRHDGETWRLKPIGDSIRAGMGIDLWPYVEKIKCPTLLLIGGAGSMISQGTVDQMKKYLPELEAVTIQGAGHMIPQEKPDDFKRFIEAFLKKLP